MRWSIIKPGLHVVVPGGYFHIKRSGGLDLTSSLEAKFGARSGHVHQIRGKPWEVLLPQDTKVGEKIPLLGSYMKFRGQNLGCLSLIFMEAKFGTSTKIAEANFWAKPPKLLTWKYPLG